ncbi:MAG: hypothetical protein JRM76_02395 [Nitrososphaerota archaeon]|nr:hypothetical protein [Nitrososphaerota archaeon]MCL5672148.1 hypothetical protein [Nitrososphaerota archaeon]MDG6912743.1 hypothetical protein [Nitrososphaerota archaeon]MDG6924420.1 hypothetical protein [Nitrososphaerota archaeon]MDG6941128.1 hypothetical protein [Nitrososphaerota archaeon]
MRNSASLVLLLLLVAALVPLQGAVHAQGAPRVDVRSVYSLNRYGFATISETVTFTNNGTSAMQTPTVTIGFGALSTNIVDANLTAGFSMSTPPSTGGPFTVSGGTSVPAGGNSSFVLEALLNNVVSTARNDSLSVDVLSSPSISTRVASLVNVVQMPADASFTSAPSGLKASILGANNTYYSELTNVLPSTANTSVRTMSSNSAQDFNPLKVIDAQRTISIAPDGTPEVTDKIEFENLGTVALARLYVSLLAPSSTQVTILTVTGNEPVLQNPFKMSLTSGAIDLRSFVVGYPSDGVQTGTEFTLTYRYPLGTNYYSASGGKVTINIPETPPVQAFIDSYSINFSLKQGAYGIAVSPVSLGAVNPWHTGKASFSYVVSLGLFLDGGLPFASVAFILLLMGLFVVRSSALPGKEAEEEEEETSTELASAMIAAFDEKTNVINRLWPEIAARDANELDKAYFDEVRGRLDSFRNKALQRLNEVKQKSTSQRFSDVVGQIQATEREVDRAAKDKLNLYQQYYLRQMRKEVYDRLLPQYTKRLERALNQLSDELHTVQREAKLI